VSKTFEIGFRGNASERLRWRAAGVPQHVVTTTFCSIRPMPCRDISPTSGRRGGKASNSASMAMPAVSTMRWRELGGGQFSVAVYAGRTARTAYASRPTCGQRLRGGYRAAGDKISRHPALTLKLRLGYADDAANAREGDDPGAGPAVRARRRKQPGRQGRVPGFCDGETGREPTGSTRNSKSSAASPICSIRGYATFGTLGSNNLLSGSAEQFRGIAAPRTIYAGARRCF